MTKIHALWLVLLCVCCYTQNSQAQILYSEDFQGGTMPTNITLIDNDGLVPNAAVNYMTDAWIVAANADGNLTALSNSWYTPVGTSDDWMSTPLIPGITATTELRWAGRARDPGFPDGYEVRVSTTTPTVAGFLANPALFTIAAESTTRTDRSASLAAYAGQSI
ncbi:MAG: choice-of-anchor J domain-containing protein, partial [Saprospiraceae bacterium]|nr:choice-of-anchor J domain-containing protein [Saprospiraceae bacterium]